MADQNITELPVKTSSGMTSSDYMLGIDSAEGYQMLIKDLGDYIIRNVQVNTIAGANQTLKSALDTLNSNLQTILNAQTTERGLSFAEHIQMQLDANKLPVGKPFFLAIDYYEKGTKPTFGYLYISANKKHGRIFVVGDNELVNILVTADVVTQKTVSVS